MSIDPVDLMAILYSPIFFPVFFPIILMAILAFIFWITGAPKS